MSTNDLISSASATTIAEIATLPICTVKTRYQSSNSKEWKKVILDMIKNEGISSFYRASIPAILSQSFSTSSKWFLYKHGLSTYANYYTTQIEPPLYIKSGIGIITGILSTTITHPLDYVRINMQNREKLSGNPYRGYTKTLGKVIIGSSLFFPLYSEVKWRIDSFKRKHYLDDHYVNTPILAAFISSIISTTIMQPLDYLKVRHIAGRSLYDQGFKISPYYRGLSLNLMRVVPHFTITMYLTEYFDKKLSKKV